MALIHTEVQLDAKVKSEVEEIFAREGMTLDDAFRYFLERTAHEKSVPYRPLNPNAETIEAMEAARRGEVFPMSSLQDLIDEIDHEDSEDEVS